MGVIVKRSLFGRTGDGKAKVCTCHGCCGMDWEDFPDTMYARLQSDWTIISPEPPVDIYVIMYKAPKVGNKCDCGRSESIISYHSLLFNFIDNGYPADTNTTCCAQVSLSASCAEPWFEGYDYEIDEGGCYWSAAINWSGGESLVVVDDVTTDPDNPNPPESGRVGCNSLSGFVVMGGFGQIPACVENADSAGGVLVTFSTGTPGGGAEADPCHYECCPDLGDTLYATLDIPDCPLLDGKVVSLYRKVGLIWIGTFGSCCEECGEYTIYFNAGLNYYPPPLAECISAITIQKSSPETGTCFSDFISVPEETLCPPHTFTGSLLTGSGCNQCCPTSSSVTVEITG